MPPSDDVVDVLLCPRSSPAQAPNAFTYVVDIPRDEPAGMYWYHPHVHGDSEYQVLKVLTSAIVDDTSAPSEPDLLANRILMVRDLEPLESAAATARQNAKRSLRRALPTLPAIRERIAREGYPQSVRDSATFRFGPPDQCDNPPPPPATDSAKNLTVNGLERPERPGRADRFTEYQRADENEPDFDITEISNPKAVEHPFTVAGSLRAAVAKASALRPSGLQRREPLLRRVLRRVRRALRCRAGRGIGSPREFRRPSRAAISTLNGARRRPARPPS